MIFSLLLACASAASAEDEMRMKRLARFDHTAVVPPSPARSVMVSDTSTTIFHASTASAASAEEMRMKRLAQLDPTAAVPLSPARPAMVSDTSATIPHVSTQPMTYYEGGSSTMLVSANTVQLDGQRLGTKTNEEDDTAFEQQVLILLMEKVKERFYKDDGDLTQEIDGSVAAARNFKKPERTQGNIVSLFSDDIRREEVEQFMLEKLNKKKRDDGEQTEQRKLKFESGVLSYESLGKNAGAFKLGLDNFDDVKRDNRIVKGSLPKETLVQTKRPAMRPEEMTTLINKIANDPQVCTHVESMAVVELMTNGSEYTNGLQNQEINLARFLSRYSFFAPEVSYDGNCFYHSLEVLISNKEYTIKTLRNAVYLRAKEDSSYDGHDPELFLGKEWADDYVISYLAIFLGVTIRIYQVKEAASGVGNALSMFDIGSAPDKVFPLLYCNQDQPLSTNGKNHYRPLVTIDTLRTHMF